MSLPDLLKARKDLYSEIHAKQRAIKTEYEPKLSSLNLQIARESKNGVGKRIKLANTGRFNSTK